MANWVEVEIPPDRSGMRLDKALALMLKDCLSRTAARAVIEAGGVEVDGHPQIQADATTRQGQHLRVRLPEPEKATAIAQPMDLAIVYEDDDVIVLDKPAGLVVHPACGNPDGTLVNGLVAHCAGRLSGMGGDLRPGIVHRLDKDTSGLMVVACHDIAHRALSAQFSGHRLARVYHALVWGWPYPSSGRIETRLARSPTDRRKVAVTNAAQDAEHGKLAITHYRTLATFGPLASLIECRLETGRTHQIRVHMSHIGHPIVGDATYGPPPRALLRTQAKNHLLPLLRAFPRQALHATELDFIHPTDNTPRHFTSPLPKDMQELVVLMEAGTKI